MQILIRKLYLRYYPPGIALLYQTANGEQALKHIDLLDLNLRTNVEKLTATILAELKESVQQTNTTDVANAEQISANCITKPTSSESLLDSLENNVLKVEVKEAILKLQHKLRIPTKKKFYLHKSQTHILPLTNVCFDRKAEYCLTGCYDRTCRIINTETAAIEHTLAEHDNVVFAMAYNYPNCDKIVTASFDGTAKVWNAATGLCQCTLYGHTAELVAAEFHPLPAKAIITTASMDGTARIFDVETALEMRILKHHGAEVIASRFSRDGNSILTGSFDRSAAIWDMRTKSIVAQLRGHTAELSNCIWNFSDDLIATGSLDSTAHIWDVRKLDQCLYKITEHCDEVLDLAFNSTGKLLATASADCTARVWNMRATCDCPNSMAIMTGHSDEVSKVCFSPPGGILMTASADHTARLWLSDSGQCTQVLAGHESEVFSCAFNYAGDMIVTASKDNTCRLWR